VSQGSVIDTGQLLQFWRSVAEVAASVAPDSDLQMVDRVDGLLPHLQHVLADKAVFSTELVPALESHLAALGFVLAPLLRIRLIFSQSWFDAYVSQLNLDADIVGSISALRSAFVVRALLDDALFVGADNDFARLLRVLSLQLPTWYAGQGRLAEKFSQALDALVRQLAEPGSACGMTTSPIGSFLQFIEMESRRAEVQRRRSVDREKSGLQVAQLAARVRQLYSDKVVGRSLPAFIDDFVRTQLLAELQFVLINHGELHPSWLLWQRLLVILPRIFTEDAHRGKPQLYAEVQQVVAMLEAPLTILSASQAAYDEFLQTLLGSLFSLLQGRTAEVRTVLSLSEAEPAVRIRAQIGRSLLKQVAMVREGDWFLFETEGGDIIRCQLALKLLDTQSLLFVNRAGVKVLQKGLNEFALCLSSRVAVGLVVKPVFEACTERAVNVLRELYDANLDRHRAVQQRAKALAAADKKLRAQAAVKARREAMMLADQRRQQQAEIDRRRLVEAAQLVDALTVGSWLELPAADADATELIRAKLAVVVPSTGKHIFVDRIGIKLAEYQREGLLSMLQQGRARVVSLEDSFESQLSKVVLGLRKGMDK
jgi:hypothetical protein